MGQQCQSVCCPLHADSSVSQSGVHYTVTAVSYNLVSTTPDNSVTQSGVDYTGTAVSASLASATRGQQCQLVWCRLQSDSTVIQLGVLYTPTAVSSQCGVHYTRTTLSAILVSTTREQQCQSVWCPPHRTTVSLSLVLTTRGQHCQPVWCRLHGNNSVSQCGVYYSSTHPCIPPGSFNRVPALAGVKAGKSPLPGGR